MIPVTVTPGITVKYAEIDRVLHGYQMELWATKDRLARDLTMAVHMTPQPPVTQAVDAITAAVDSLQTLRQWFRDAAPAGTETHERWPA